eukprot:scaffold1453_cov112-Isochrysis_galbana.AAC.14
MRPYAATSRSAARCSSSRAASVGARQEAESGAGVCSIGCGSMKRSGPARTEKAGDQGRQLIMQIAATQHGLQVCALSLSRQVHWDFAP